jgi:hypothetical protein
MSRSGIDCFRYREVGAVALEQHRPVLSPLIFG